MVGWVWWRLAGRSGVSAGFATVVRLICGGWVPQDLVSSHVRCLVVERGRRGRLLIARSADGCLRECREGPGRLANRHGLW